MSTQSSNVYEDVAEILGSFVYGLSMPYLWWIEESYWKKFEKPLDYESLGVKNIEELLVEMRNKRMAVIAEDPESKVTIVMTVRIVQQLQLFLKRNVQSELRRCSGEIPLNYLERIYKDRWLLELEYHHFGLTGFDHLCKVFNLEVGPNNSGDMVIRKAKILGKRKKRN